MLRITKRSITSIRFYSVSPITNIGKQLVTSSDIDNFLDSPTWSTSKLLQGDNADVDDKLLDGLLELSGLSKNISAESRSKVRKSLNDQINLIAKLGEVELNTDAKSVIRLVDDQSVKPLTLETLRSTIELVKPEFSKGEIENSWEPLTLASQVQNKYFLVKEGLEKNNK